MGLDFVCLQEVFDLRAAHRLVRILVPNLGPVLYDVGTFGLVAGPYIKFLGGGLLLASRYPLLRAAFRCFPNGRREDALASKGLLSVQVLTQAAVSPSGERVSSRFNQESKRDLELWVVLQAQLGILDGRCIVGFLHCTHLHAPAEDCHIRCKQLTLLLEWVEEFEAESRQSGEAIAFSVLLGDLNFDNCSQGTILNSSMLRHSTACSPEMLRRALEQEKGRRLYMAGPLHGSYPAQSWKGRRLDYITYRGVSGSRLSPVRGRAGDIQYCVCWTHGPFGYGPEASSGMLLTLAQTRGNDYRKQTTMGAEPSNRATQRIFIVGTLIQLPGRGGTRTHCRALGRLEIAGANLVAERVLRRRASSTQVWLCPS
ncbi:Sphingomyelin phosphodiesterase 5 [Apodemus speciosus]|uniref:sphingomyelin phosphodiesterase n=1 Tax=Apodemus speciosus TaxID=105296 RepID=A0ABQ0FJS0_APOSI